MTLRNSPGCHGNCCNAPSGCEYCTGDTPSQLAVDLVDMAGSGSCCSSLIDTWVTNWNTGLCQWDGSFVDFCFDRDMTVGVDISDIGGGSRRITVTVVVEDAFGSTLMTAIFEKDFPGEIDCDLLASEEIPLASYSQDPSFDCDESILTAYITAI